MTNKTRFLAFFGHHKAGTTWISNIVGQATRKMGRKHCYIPRAEMFNHNLEKFIEQERIDSLSYVNADFKHVKDLDNFKGFHVVRDPRDIVVSAYFSHLHSHVEVDTFPELTEYRNKLQNLPKDEGLALEMLNFRRQQFETMYNWNYSLPNIQEIKMEDLVHNPYDKFLDIFDFLEVLDNSPVSLKASLFLPINQKFHIRTDKIFAEKLLGIVYQNRFSKKSKGRKLGEEDIKSHYRKGISGDWKNHFNEEHVRLFKENYNHLLIKLGYESDSNW